MIIEYTPIGVVHSPFLESKGTPIQPSRSNGARGTVEVFPEFAGRPQRSRRLLAHHPVVPPPPIDGVAPQGRALSRHRAAGALRHSRSLPAQSHRSVGGQPARGRGQRALHRELDLLDGTPFSTSNPMSESSTTAATSGPAGWRPPVDAVIGPTTVFRAEILRRKPIHCHLHEGDMMRTVSTKNAPAPAGHYSQG